MNRSILLLTINSSFLSAKQLSTSVGVDFIYSWNEKITVYSLANLDELIEESLISLIIANAAQGLDYESSIQDLNRLGLIEKLTSQDRDILRSQASENDMVRTAWKFEYARVLLWSMGLLTELIASRECDDYSAVLQLATLNIKDLKKVANFQPIEKLIEQYIFYKNYFDLYESFLKPGATIGMEPMIGPLGYQVVVNRVAAFQRLLTFN